MESSPSSAATKRARLKHDLEALIAVGNTGDQLPTYAEMLERFNVGQATVDYVVLQLANEGKVERRRGSGLYITSSAKQRSIALVYEWDSRKASDSPFERRLIDTVRERVTAQGQHYAFYLHVPFEDNQTATDRANFVRDIEAGRLQGVIVVGNSEPLMKLLETNKVPHVLLSTASTQTNQVCIDYKNVIDQAVNALAYSQSRRIGLITSHGVTRLKEPSFREDLDAFEAAITRHRLEFIPQAIIEHKVDVSTVPSALRETNLEIGYWAATSLFEGEKVNPLGLDGLVVLDDHYTQGVLLAFDDLGLKVPQDIRIASHSIKDCTPLKYRANKLILLETDIEAIVDALFLVLDKWIAQGVPPQRIHRLPATLRLPMAY